MHFIKIKINRQITYVLNRHDLYTEAIMQINVKYFLGGGVVGRTYVGILTVHDVKCPQGRSFF